MFVQKKLLYFVLMVIPAVIVFTTIILGLVKKNAIVLLIGTIILIFATWIIIILLHKIAKKVICKDKKFENIQCLKGQSSYKGIWNNEEILYRIQNLEKEMLYKFLEKEKKNTQSEAIKIIEDIEKLMEKSKFVIPIIPTFFGGLIVAWYSAYANWVFDRYEMISEIMYPVGYSLSIIILMFVLYQAMKMIFKAIDEIFYSQENNRRLKFKNIIEEILMDLNEMQK